MAEVRSALYPLAQRPQVLGYIVGLGGRDVHPEVFKDMVDHALKEIEQGPSRRILPGGVRG